MTFVAGETLGTRLRRDGALPVPQALGLAREIADGLAAAHEVGVVHRDLKPENIMVTPEGHALIMDFGIASSSEAPAKDRLVVGTLEYMAPEQARGRAVDGRADIYSFGLILHDLLTGRRRFEGHASAMAELLARETAPPAPVRAVRPEVPTGVDALVTCATQPDAARRFKDAPALRAALAALDEHGEPVPTASAGARWPAVAAAVALTSLVGLGAWWATASRSDTPHDPVSVLVADFENRTGDPVFDGVVEQALGLGIEGASFISAYPRRDALRVAATIKPGAPLDEETARLVALREGVALVLTGSVERWGRYRISTRALAGGDQQPVEVYARSVEASGKEAVLDAVGRLAGDVREALGDTAVPRGGAAAGETFTAASLEAARAYATAQELQWAGRVEEAIAQYRQTLALDPDMGRAHSGLAAQYANLGRLADAERSYQDALARLDRMTDREKYRTRGSYYLFARKPDLAMQEFTALVQAYPADSSGLSNLALAAFYRRDMAQALEQGRRAAQIFPRNVLRRSNVALYAMYAGRFEEAIDEAAAVHELNPTHLKAFVAKALSLLALGRPDEARTAYEQLAATGAAGASFAAAGVADMAIYAGRLADAVASLDVAIANDLAAKNMAAAAAKRLALADARLSQGNPGAASLEAEQALQTSDSDVVRAGAGLILAAAGRASRADDPPDARRTAGGRSPGLRPPDPGRDGVGGPAAARRGRARARGAEAGGHVDGPSPARARLPGPRRLSRGLFRTRGRAQPARRGDGRLPGRRADAAAAGPGALLHGAGAGRPQEPGGHRDIPRVPRLKQGGDERPVDEAAAASRPPDPPPAHGLTPRVPAALKAPEPWRMRIFTGVPVFSVAGAVTTAATPMAPLLATEAAGTFHAPVLCSNRTTDPVVSMPSAATSTAAPGTMAVTGAPSVPNTPVITGVPGSAVTVIGTALLWMPAPRTLSIAGPRGNPAGRRTQ